MADINFGILDTQMPGRIAAIPQQAQAQQAQNALQLMQLQQSMGQNELAKYQLSAAQRADQTQNAISRAYQESIGPDGTLDYTKLQSRLAAGGAGSSIPELQNKRLTAENLAARTEASKATTNKANFELTGLKIDRARTSIAAAPNSEAALAAINKNLAAGNIDAEDARILIKDLGDSATFAEGKARVLQTMLSAKDQLAQQAIKTVDTDRGGFIERQAYDAQGKAVGTPIMLPKTQTPGQVQTAADALAGRQQSERHFQAGGYTYDLDRGIRIDRNGIATPLMQKAPLVGGTAVGDGAPVSKMQLPYNNGSAPATAIPLPYTSGGAPATTIPLGGGIPTGRGSAAGLVPLGPKPEKATESYLKEVKGVINTNDAINNLKQIISNFTPADMVNPARRAEIDTAHKTAVLLSKEMFNLGVLNGGDQKILEQVIPDPIAFSKGLVPIETIRKNLDAASNVVNRMNNTLSRVHKQPLLSLDAGTPNAPSPSAPPIESFRRK